MRAYVDTSVLLRVVLGRPGRLRSWRRITEPMSSELLRVEALRVIDRVRVQEKLPEAEVAHRKATVLQHIDSFTLAGLSRRILDRASGPLPSPVGTLDAIHLATALALRRRFADLAMATHDDEMRQAATALGFRLLD